MDARGGVRNAVSPCTRACESARARGRDAYVRVRTRMRVRVRAPGRVKDRERGDAVHELHSLDLDALGLVLQGFVWLRDMLVTPRSF